jgi:hypothetical protein
MEKLCECDRPDEKDNPHRHELSVACIYWERAKKAEEELNVFKY